ncbi:MAG TPA: four helix bundle protein [Chitinophagales bacterium]|nr:four helix bundle protein [Chitinophagales bacterium]HNM31673.1 four helix bundle protein [Chitinophagales bacterium]
MAFKFEDLKIWQRALDISFKVNELTKSFPKDEIYILSSQIKRAADSISLNIAEGSTGQSDAEFNRFLGISMRSAIEVIACLHIAKRRNIVDDNQFNELYNEIESLIISIQSLRKILKNKKTVDSSL